MLLEASKASLLLVDVQDRLLPAMADGEQVVRNSRLLLQVAKTLGLPVTVSEQYPKGLGHTVSALADNAGLVFEKTSFSCWRDDALRKHFIALHEAARPLVIVAGIEAHVCVLQTCVDLSAAGFGVFVVADAVSSRKQLSVELALNRMAGNGAQVVNTEMVMFELLEKAGTPQFKELSALIR